MATAEQERGLAAYLAAHHHVIGRQEALRLGLSVSQIKRRLQTGHWEVVLPGVYVPAGTPVDHDVLLAAACLRAGPGAAASHRSAAWLWGLLRQPPERPALSTTGRPPNRRSRVEVHLALDLDCARLLVRRGIPTTDPIRTLADLGAVVSARELNDAVDRALATRLLTVKGLEAEIVRLGRQGRQGILELRRALTGRGMAGTPDPSVLESRVHRLLRSWGFAPVGTEVSVCEGRYRVDVLIREGVVLEVDGYAYHWSPEAKAADSHRRNDLRRDGMLVIEADWVTVMRQPDLLRAEIAAALAEPCQLRPGPPHSE